MLTRIAQIRQLTAAQAARGYPVRVRAVVTYYSPSGPSFLGRDAFMNGETPDLFVEDATAGIWVNLPKGAPPLRAGQLVEMDGVTEIPDFAPQIGKPRYRVIGTAPLPEPKRPSLERMISSAEDSQWVETQGIVRQVKLLDGLLTLDVAVPGGRLKALVPGIRGPVPTQFVDAEVRIRGACGAIFNNKLQLLGILLYVPDLSQVQALKTPGDPFAKPVAALDTVARFAPQRSQGHRIRVQGTVTLQNARDHLRLRRPQRIARRIRGRNGIPAWRSPGCGGFPARLGIHADAGGRRLPAHRKPGATDADSGHRSTAPHAAITILCRCRLRDAYWESRFWPIVRLWL